MDLLYKILILHIKKETGAIQGTRTDRNKMLAFLVFIRIRLFLLKSFRQVFMHSLLKAKLFLFPPQPLYLKA